MKNNTLKNEVNSFGGTSEEASSTNLGRMLEPMIEAFSILNTLISDVMHGLINIAKSLANSMMGLMLGIGLGLLALSTAILGTAIVAVGGASALAGGGAAIFGFMAAFVGGSGTGMLTCLAGTLLAMVGMGLFSSNEIFFGSSDRSNNGIVQKLFGASGDNLGQSWGALKGMFQASSAQRFNQVMTVEAVHVHSDTLSAIQGPAPEDAVKVEAQYVLNETEVHGRSSQPGMN